MPIPPLNKPATMSQRLGFQDPDLTTPEHDAMVFWTKKYIQKKCYESAKNSTEKAFNERINNIKAEIDKLKKDGLDFDLDKGDTYLDAIGRTKEENELLRSERNKISCSMHSFRVRNLHLNLYSNHPEYAELSAKDGKLHHLIKAGEELEKTLLQLNEIESLENLIIRYGQNKPDLNFTIKDCSKIELEYAIANPKNNFIIGYADIKAISISGTRCGIKNNGLEYYLKRSSTEYYIEVKPRIQSFGELLRQIRTYETITGKNTWYVACPDTRFKDDLEDEGVKFIQITEDYKEYL